MCASSADDAAMSGRNTSIALGVLGPIHLTHAALADQSGHFIRAEASAWCEGHGLLPRRGWETSDPVAGDAANPYLFPDLNGDGPKDQEVVGGVADDLLGRESLRIDLRNPGRHPVALALPEALPNRSPRPPEVTGGKQRLAWAPADVVDMKPDLHRVFLDRCPSTRQANQRLASITADKEPLTVSRDLQAIRTNVFAARYKVPPGAGMPFPHVACPRTRSRKATFRKSDHGIQPEGLRRHRASNPGEGRRSTAHIELEDFDRFPRPVANDIQRVGARCHQGAG